MNKTIFNLSYKASLTIMAILGVLFGFLSNAYYINGFLELIFYVFRFLMFIGVYLLIYLLEKGDENFKSFNKRMMGILVLSSIVNTIFAIFSSAHLLGGLFIVLSGVVCFILIMSFVIEIINVFHENKVFNIIVGLNKKIGNAFANPIVKSLEAKITND